MEVEIKHGIVVLTYESVVGERKVAITIDEAETLYAKLGAALQENDITKGETHESSSS